MSEARHPLRWIAAVLAALVAIAIAVWRLDAPAPAPPVPREPEPIAESPPSPPPEPLPLEPAAERYQIAERGRIAIASAAFVPGTPVAFELALPDAARGSEPRPVRVAAIDGRQLRTSASLSSEPGGGVRLELDPAWLLPGRYLIEVTTAEKTHFPMRRYVLEVR